MFVPFDLAILVSGLHHKIIFNIVKNIQSALKLSKYSFRLDLPDRLIDELWIEVHIIVKEIGIKTIPRKRNAKKQNDSMRSLERSCEKKRS